MAEQGESGRKVEIDGVSLYLSVPQQAQELLDRALEELQRQLEEKKRSPAIRSTSAALIAIAVESLIRNMQSEELLEERRRVHAEIQTIKEQVTNYLQNS
ncbi:MAG: hypothetical protein CSA97_03095 [Bacteroidetes bacterium]|nr:MAG: hypothetical protein CSA97_03095 [Bacteroidota bacterium]